MKIPVRPKSLADLLAQESSHLSDILSASIGPTPEGKYLHWDKLRHRTPPQGLTSEQWWTGVRFARKGLERNLPLTDENGLPFTFSMPPLVTKYLHDIDSKGSGRIAMPSEVSDPETKTRFLVSSLIEEAITSSQLEGASTTRKKAVEMFRSGKQPTNKSEQMIFNNMRGMEFIRQNKEEQLTPELVLAIHAEMMKDTIEDNDLGRLQTPDNRRVNVVSNNTQKVVHKPPPADQLPGRLKAMCRFANGKGEKEFIHPVIRAIALHFWLAYDHPFEDGNGRTARALFYWSMLNSGYWLFEYISISSILRQASGQYARAYLYTETDANDATYFIVHQLRVIESALHKLERYLERKTREIRRAENLLQSVDVLNYRQLALLGHALRKPHADFTIHSHKTSHRVAYATARADLLSLVKIGYLEQRTIGNAMHFKAGSSLLAMLATANQKD